MIFKNKILAFLLVVICCFVLTNNNQLQAQPPDSLRSFIFGNSLVNHVLQVNPTPSQETAVPHWIGLLTQEANKGYAVSGQFGFLPGHAGNLPPISQWGFDFANSAWESDYEPFSAANFDNLVITPANFTQYQAPDINYFGEDLSPVTATQQIIDWGNTQEDNMDIFIYEGWPDMATFLSAGFPPTQSEWVAYNNYLQTGYHEWFLIYYDMIRDAYPNQCVRMLPVGLIISNLLMQEPYDQIALTELYEDDAPHGRATIYFLAALINYMALYGEPAPITYQVPDIIEPTIAENYVAIVFFMWEQLLLFTDNEGNNIAFCTSPATNTPVTVNTRAFLEGCYNTTTQSMSTLLRDSNLLPIVQPFNTAPWWYEGTESVANNSNLPADMVNWVLLELRDANNASTLIAQKAAALLSNGQIIDVDNQSSGVVFNSIAESTDYYIALKTTNHLAVLSQHTVSLPNTETYDFTTESNVWGGVDQLSDVGNGNYALIAGDWNSDGIITVGDFNGYVLETALSNQYIDADFNLDGFVTVDDFNLYVPNASTIGTAVVRY